MTYLDHNRRGWDGLAAEGHVFCRPPSEAEFQQPLATLDGQGWLGADLTGTRVLCLGAGGGRQGPLYAAAGAEVTVVDISDRQLDVDRRVAAERRLAVRLVRTSMEDLSMLADASFDIVAQPVSSCYVPRLDRLFAEIGRVLRCQGLYVSQHKTPTSLQVNANISTAGWVLETAYYHQGPLPPAARSRIRETGTIEYLHRWESLLGGLCRHGFVIEDVAEPWHGDPQAEPGTFAHRCHYIAPYVRLKARRVVSSGGPSAPGGKLWVPTWPA